MERDDGRELADYAGAGMQLAIGGSILLGLTRPGKWLTGTATTTFRDDLLSAVDVADAAHRRLSGRFYPAPTSGFASAIQTLRRILQNWVPEKGTPTELGEATMALVQAMRFFDARYEPTSPDEDDRADGRDRLGLPLPRAGLRTFYNSPARTLLAIVEPRRVRNEWRDHRLFVRHVDVAEYREVALPERSHVAEVVVCASAPTAYVHVLRMEENGGGNDGGILLLALPEGTTEPVPWSLPSSPELSGGWISRLLGTGPDGSTLDFVMTGSTESDEKCCTIGYQLVTAETATGTITGIAPMPGIFA
jgi:hypothetical protein